MSQIIKTAVIVDAISGLPAATEAGEMVEGLQEHLGDEIVLDLVAAGQDVDILGGRVVDLLLVDYGGLSGGGAVDAARYQIRAVCQWADRHPGKLVVLWTTHTAKVYQFELRREFGDLGNIVLRYEDDWRVARVPEHIRGWYGGAPLGAAQPHWLGDPEDDEDECDCPDCRAKRVEDWDAE